MPSLATHLSCTIAAAALSLCAASVAAAAPSAQALPAAVRCSAAAPAQGEHFSGPVLQVMDGQRLCIATGPTPDQWVEVRPAGLVKAAQTSPAADRSLLMTAAFSKRLDCVAGPRIDGAVQAVCTVEGAPLSAEVQSAADGPAWRLWR
jgi:hypothetical protein